MTQTEGRDGHLWLKRKPFYDKEAEGELLISSFLPQSRAGRTGRAARPGGSEGEWPGAENGERACT